METKGHVIEFISKLKSLVFRFDKNSFQEKLELLYFFNRAPAHSGKSINELHKVLLCMLAYPASEKHYKLTEKTMHHLISQAGSKKSLNYKLSGSGIYLTQTTDCNFSYELVRYVTGIFPGEISIRSSTADSETVKNIFRVLLPSVEYADVHEGDLDLKKRINLFNKSKNKTNLEWFLSIIEEKVTDQKLKELIYHQAEIFLSGRMSKKELSVSFLRGTALPLYFHSAPLQKKIAPPDYIFKKLPNPVKLKSAENSRLMQAAKLTLFYLNSETEPFNNANEGDLTLFDLENGISIGLFGSNVNKRYSLESYIGYLVLKNNIPVAYGGGWLFGHRCQFGINILEPFRGGESNLIFSQLIRVYHQYYNAGLFVVKPYQFGHKNPEGLKAGAFWFYYNMGFRPENRQLLELANQEADKRNADKTYRSDLATLKKFTGCNMNLHVLINTFPLYDAEELSKKITGFVNKNFNSDREKAMKYCFKELCDSLQVKSSFWKFDELIYTKNISLLFCMKPDSRKWIHKNRKEVIKFIRLKSEKTERPWILHLQKFHSFWEKMND